MAVIHTPLQSYQAQLKRFQAVQMTMDSGVRDIRRETDKDLHALVTGAVPSGPGRRRWLAQEHHPFGRGYSSLASTPTSRKRGNGRRGAARNLPIGEITGQLKSSAFTSLEGGGGGAYIITAGFSRRGGKSLFAVLPGGTRKTVDRGLWDVLGKRFKARLKAYRDHFLRANRIP